MDQLIAYTIIGIVTGSIYAIGASGLVLTYATSGIFNIAHGAIGMIMAFLYWELRVHQGWPGPLALIVVLLIIAPLFGAAVERVLMRGLRNASFGTSLVVTVGLMVGLIGAANTIWSPTESRQLSELFGSSSGIDLGSVFVSFHQLITILIAGAVALFLWLFLSRTRIGIAMRAVVDDRNLIALNGARPDRISMLSWAMGSTLAATAGILIAPALQLNVLLLTFLVINAYAAAMVGRLKSLPLTFIGAIALGLIETYAISYIDLEGWLLGLRPALPTLFLFAILLLLPQDRLRAGKLAGAKTPPIPGFRRSVEGGIVLVGACVVLSLVLGDADIARVGKGLALGVVMLSLVLLTGYGGQVSLAQMTFAGLGAFAMGRFGADLPIAGLVLAMLLAGAAGAIVTLPALRLQGLYLALATMAFAVFMDQMVFTQAGIFGVGGGLTVPRLSVLGISFSSEGAYFVLLAIVFSLVGILLLMLRRGPFGRLLAAMRDSEIACATLGLSLARTKFAVFALSAAIAGLGGVMVGGLQTTAGPVDYQMLQSMPILLLAVVGGINSISGALIGGMSLAMLSILEEKATAIAGIVFLLIGAAAVSLGRNPNGVAFMVTRLRLDRLIPALRRRPEPLPVSGGADDGEAQGVAASG
jgi:branched-chain amino acid transport system permease protein